MSNSHAKKAYELVQSVIVSVAAAHSKISETDSKLTEVSDRVDKNRADVTVSKKEREEKIKRLEGLINTITNDRI